MRPDQLLDLAGRSPAAIAESGLCCRCLAAFGHILQTDTTFLLGYIAEIPQCPLCAKVHPLQNAET